MVAREPSEGQRDLNRQKSASTGMPSPSLPLSLPLCFSAAVSLSSTLPPPPAGGNAETADLCWGRACAVAALVLAAEGPREGRAIRVQRVPRQFAALTAPVDASATVVHQRVSLPAHTRSFLIASTSGGDSWPSGFGCSARTARRTRVAAALLRGRRRTRPAAAAAVLRGRRFRFLRIGFGFGP